jgi:hypothetical protein
MSQSRLCGSLLAGFVAIRTGVFGVNTRRIEDTPKYSCVIKRENIFPFLEFPINRLGLTDHITIRRYDNLTKKEIYMSTSTNGNFLDCVQDIMTSFRPIVICHYKALNQREKSVYDKLSPDEQLKYIKDNNLRVKQYPNDVQLSVRREYDRSPMDLFSWLYVRGDL